MANQIAIYAHTKEKGFFQKKKKRKRLSKDDSMRRQQGTSESLEPSKLRSFILADPIKATQSSTIIILL